MTENEREEALERGAKFLEYVAKHKEELRYALLKNVKFDKSLVDDVFQNTIIKVYNSIVKNNTPIDNFKSYFFISSKWEYTHTQIKKERENATKVGDDSYEVMHLADDSTAEEDEERAKLTVDILNCVKELLSEEFGEEWSEIYLDYILNRNQQTYTMKTVATSIGKEYKEVYKVFTKMKEYLQNNELIGILKGFYKYGIH